MVSPYENTLDHLPLLSVGGYQRLEAGGKPAP